MVIAIQNSSNFPNRLIRPHLQNLLRYQNQVAQAYYDKYDHSAQRVQAASRVIFAHPGWSLPISSWPVAVTEESDPGILGLHYWESGKPKAKMFMPSVRLLGAELSDQAEILITAMSHEIAEMTANPGAERVVAYTHGGVRRRWVREVCDPVNENGYTITHKGVSSIVADWVKPGWFLGVDGLWDAAGELTKHHEILSGGYMDYQTDDDVFHTQNGPFSF